MRYVVLWVGLFVVVTVGAAWAFQGNDFFLTKVFAPKYEAVRRQTFEESKAYNEGMAQELSAAQLDYAKADKDQKAAIRSVLLHRYAGYDKTKLPPDLQAFYAAMLSDEGGAL